VLSWRNPAGADVCGGRGRELGKKLMSQILREMEANWVKVVVTEEKKRKSR
jgi:hypothetical protein